MSKNSQPCALLLNFPSHGALPALHRSGHYGKEQFMDKRPDRLFVLLSAQTPLAHGDPGADTDSNIVPFRMDPVFSRRPAEERKDEVGNLSQPLNVAEEAIRMLAARYPLPPGSPLTASLQGLAAEDFLACAFTYSLISQLTGRNKGEGEGLFTGPSRYDMLLKRLALASSPFNPTFFDVYASLLRDLRVESHLDGFVDLLGYYAALPAGIQQAAIAKLRKNRQSVVLIARAWYNATKGEASQQRLLENVYYDPTGKVAGSSTCYVEALVPTISSNSFRHSIFRATLCDHLFSELGLGSVAQAQEEKLIPPFVAMMLSNAGNINAKVKVPSYTEAITAAAQKLFPSIELLGVTFPTHMTKSLFLLPTGRFAYKIMLTRRHMGTHPILMLLLFSISLPIRARFQMVWSVQRKMGK